MFLRTIAHARAVLSCFVIPMVVCLVAAGASHASCGFETAGKAKGYRVAFTRAFVPCGTLSPFTPNVSTKSGVLGCAPTVASSPFKFSEKGRCRLNLRQVAESTCKQGDRAAGCQSLRISARCSGVLSPNDEPTASVNWRLRLTFRATIGDELVGPMTVVDSPVTLTFPPPLPGELGQLILTGRVPTCDLLLTDGCIEQFPTCASLELLSAVILDPNGDVFASMGSVSR